MHPFLMLVSGIPDLHVMATKAPLSSLNIMVSREGDKAPYVKTVLVPESECPELPFPLTFTGISVLHAFLIVS